MATPLKEPQGKILFKRTDIRTMRKDMKMLREVDLHKEAEKVTAPVVAKTTPTPSMKLTINEAPVAPKAPVQPQKPAAPALAQEKAFEQIAKQDEQKMAQARPYASEAEKQQIFAFEGQIAEIKKELITLGSEKQPALNLEKNQVLLQQTAQKDILGGLIKEEEKIDQEIAVVEKSAAAISVPADRQHLERERANMENKRQEIEKKRWTVEQELSKLENQMKGLETQYGELTNQETALREEIAGINDALRTIYAGIIERENQKAKEQKTQPKKVVAPTAPTPTSSSQTNEIKPITPVKETDSGEKGVPEAFKEKMAQSATTENEQRRKFMEDIENWANSDKK